MSSGIPPWFAEHCSRLQSKEEHVTNLNLNIRRVDLVMMQALSVALTHANNHLQVLNLTSALLSSSATTRDNDVGNDSDNNSQHDPLLPLAAGVLPNSTTLRVLYLSYNRLRNVTAVGRALATNRHLVELHLDHNRIGATSAEALAAGLRHNTSLTVLQLNSNHIGDQGCQSLASALTITTPPPTPGAAAVGPNENSNDERRRRLPNQQHQQHQSYNRTLRVLGMSHNGVTARGADAMLQTMMFANYSLTHVALHENNSNCSARGIQQQERLLDPTIAGRRIQLYARANAAGRGLLLGCCGTSSDGRKGSGAGTPGLWPALLARCSQQSDLLYLFLRTKTDLCQRGYCHFDCKGTYRRGRTVAVPQDQTVEMEITPDEEMETETDPDVMQID